LILSLYLMDKFLPDLFRSDDYIPITLASFGGFLFYIIIKKIIAYYGERLVPGPMKRKISREIILALVIWFFTFIIIENADYRLANTIGPFWGLWIPCAYILVMLNIYWLIPDFEKSKKGFSAYWSKAIVLTLLVSFPFAMPFAGKSFWTLLFFCLTQAIITLPLAWYLYQSNKERIQQLMYLQKELGRTTADLQFLRSQINPHFLFNALNTLYGTALQEKSERAARGIQKLGDMMRFMLHENVQDMIPLEKEVEYLRNYIELQQLRTQVSDDIQIETHLNEQGCNHQIAPMLLIPFVENAFKHGISLKEPSWVKISLTCDADNLYFDVYNSLHRKLEGDPEKDESGIGLTNLKQRLHLLYPQKHELIVRETAREFMIHLTINF
jgi:two-component system LytT family sensor kinase